MPWHLPVFARWLPRVGVTRALLLLSFFPFSVVGARALIYHMTMAIAVLLLAGVGVSMVLAHRKDRSGAPTVMAAVVAAIPALAITRAAVVAMRIPLVPAVMATVAIAAAAAVAFGAALHACAEADPHVADARACPAAYAAAWFSIVAVLLRFGSETGHLHIVFPTAAAIVTACAALLAAIATATLVTQRSWIVRLYRNELVLLRVAPMPADVDPDALPVLSVGENDAALTVEAAQVGAYRAGQTAVARVPSSPERLLGRYTHAARVAGLGFAWSLLGIVAWSHAASAHVAESAGAPMMRVPFGCRGPREVRWPTVRFVALAPFELVDVEQIAQRYRNAGLPDVSIEPPLAFDERFLDRQRNQLLGDDVARAAREVYLRSDRGSPPPNQPHQLIIVLTDRDMYLPGKASFAFAVDERDVAVNRVA